MNEAIFESDQLHGSMQPAKPMNGDRPGDQPVTQNRTCGERAGYGKCDSCRELANKCAKLESRLDSYRHANDSKADQIQKMKEQQEEDMRGRKQQITRIEAENTRLRADKAELIAWVAQAACAVGEFVDNNGVKCINPSFTTTIIEEMNRLIKKHKKEDA